MHNNIGDKYVVFSQVQKDNLLAISNFLKILKLHVFFSVVFFCVINFYWIVLDYSIPPIFSDFIPKIYRGKGLIVESSGIEFYNFSGLMYFIGIVLIIIFSIFYFIELFSYKIEIRLNHYRLMSVGFCTCLLRY